MTFDSVYIAALKSQLEEIGYANDEQVIGPQSSGYTFKYHKDALFAALRSAGYDSVSGIRRKP